MASAVESVGAVESAGMDAGVALAAEIIVGGGRRAQWAVDATVTRLGERTMDLRLARPTGAVAALDDEDFVWADVELPGGEKIRPLCEILTVSNEGLTVRYKHLFPDHRARLVASRPAVGRGLYAAAL